MRGNLLLLELPVAHVQCQSRMFRGAYAARTQTSYTNLPNNCCSYVNSQSATPFASLRIRVRVMQIRPVYTQRGPTRRSPRRWLQYTEVDASERELAERDSERGVARGRRRDGNAPATMIGLVEIRFARITRPTRAAIGGVSGNSRSRKNILSRCSCFFSSLFALKSILTFSLNY